MMHESVARALNEQINKELFSAYLYLSMASWCDAEGYPGSAHWMQIQVKEELFHASLFHGYLLQRDVPVVLEAIGKPEAEFDDLNGVFSAALAHEQKISASINEIYRIAREEVDPMTETRLHWFINEQVEEEQNARDILDKIKLAGAQPAGLLLLDNELAARPEPTLTPPSFAG